MQINDQNRSTWLGFFQAAETFRDMAAWEWMRSGDIFGVQDPLSGEIGWCCITGSGGQVFALAVYPGTEGYQSLVMMEMAAEDGRIVNERNAGLAQQVLMVEFANRNEMEEADLKLLKQLGIKCRGAFQWIRPREMRDSYYPFHLTDDRARFLTLALQQAVDVSRRVLDDDLPLLVDDSGDCLLVRVPRETPQGLAWDDTYLPEPPRMPESHREINPELVKKAKKAKLKVEQRALCVSLSYPQSIIKGEKKQDRPYFPRLCLWVDYASAFVMGLEIFSPEDFPGKFDVKFIEKLNTLGFIPSQVIANSLLAYYTLEPLAEALGIQLVYAPDVEAFKEVDDFMRRGL